MGKIKGNAAPLRFAKDSVNCVNVTSSKKKMRKTKKTKKTKNLFECAKNRLVHLEAIFEKN